MMLHHPAKILVVLALGFASVSLLSAKEARLEWDPPLQNAGRPVIQVSHYNVYVSLDGNFSCEAHREYLGSTPKGQPEVRYFKITVLEDGITRYFATTTVDMRGVESNFSNVVGISSSLLKGVGR